MSYSLLKSGTDIRGFAADGFENEPLFLSDEKVEKIALGFVNFLCNKTGKKSDEISVCVGHDSRVSAERIKAALLRAFSSKGVSVFDCSLASTPAMFMAVLDLKCDGSVQITASHHPWERNGLKFFTPDGGLEGSDISAILSDAEKEDNDSLVLNESKITPVDYMSTYAQNLREMIKSGVNSKNYDKPLEGYKIIVDAGNGVGGFYAENVLKPLGADVTGSQFLNPDGMFPNHIPNPENADAMASVTKATVENGADLGVIFDTDVDRAGCVDKNGEEINRNNLVALASVLALEGSGGGVIVTDSVTSDGIPGFIKSLGGEHYRYKRGYRNVINKQIELNNEGKFCPLAIETSGHAAFKENYYLDDGAYLMTKIIIYMAKHGADSIKKVLSTLAQPKEAKELRFNITCEDFKSYGNAVLDNLVAYFGSKDGWRIADDNRDGIRISAGKENGDGWILLRLSVHDPVMPFNAESNLVGGVKVMLNEFYNFIKEQKSLDITPIENFFK
ncbi:MAG: phosphomannomutase/phosphoglucomutase [Clostridia bacterium]|nr:phosphomannomutase/phosphoglucomutase [Clostridia bacterium]